MDQDFFVRVGRDCRDRPGASPRRGTGECTGIFSRHAVRRCLGSVGTADLGRTAVYLKHYHHHRSREIRGLDDTACIWFLADKEAV